MSFKKWIFLSLFLFVAGLLWGLATPIDTSGLLAEDVAALEELAAFLAPLPQQSLFTFIFLKNVLAIAVSFAFSPFFYLAPVMALILNGGILGVISILVIQEKSLGFLLAGLVPHGILEIPAFIIAQAAAFSFGTATMLAVLKKEKRKLLIPNLRQNSRYLAISVALLLVAAIIETYLTPLFLAG
ncbi:MAG: stage II sporulation protein M [Dehalococcoidales bacterium]